MMELLQFYFLENKVMKNIIAMKSCESTCHSLSEEHATLDIQKGNIKGSSSQIHYKYIVRAWSFMQTISHCSSSGLIDDTQHVQILVVGKYTNIKIKRESIYYK